MSTTPPADDDRTQYVPPPGAAAKAGASAAPTTPAAPADPDLTMPAPLDITEVDFEPTQLAPSSAASSAPASAAASHGPTPGEGAAVSATVAAGLGMAPTMMAPPPASALSSPAPSPGAPSSLSAPAPKAGPSASSAGDSGNALPMGTYIQEYELTGVIGEGGFGIVYHAWDHQLQRKVALKEYMPASLASRERSVVQVRSLRHKETFDAGLKSFINEARLLAQFDHPSLVKVYRFWESNGTAYMVMPLYEGMTLKDKLRQLPGKPDEAWLMSLLAPLTDALVVIHKENCFHRDIAPDNIILLAGSERPLLLDFGAARRVIGDMTQALTVILKPGYAPVEQYAESPDMKQGSWTDVYALAATVHWAIMGKTPPPSVSRLMNDSFQPLSKTAAGRYSERFLMAMDHALQVRPEHRTPSIGAFRAEIGLDAGWIPGTQVPGGMATGMPPPAMQPYSPTAMPGAMHGATPGTAMPGSQHAGGMTSFPNNQPTVYGGGGTQFPPGATAMPGQRTFMPEQPHEVTMMAPRNQSGGFEKTQMAFDTRAAAEGGHLPTGMIPARTPAPPVQTTGPGVGGGTGGNKSMLWIGIAAALLVTGGVGGYMMFGGKKAATPPSPNPQAQLGPGQTAPAPQAPGSAVAPPPPPQQAPAPAVFNVREQFDRVVNLQTGGFSVEAGAERTQLKISAKDKLVFNVTSSRDGYLHVMARGPDGSLTVLFPNDKMKESRVKAGQRVVLPHKEWAIVVGEPAGTEHLLVIVANAPRDFSQIAEEKAFDYRTVPVGTRANTLLQQWRSPLPILLGSGPKDCQGPACDEYGAAMFSVQVVQ